MERRISTTLPSCNLYETGKVFVESCLERRPLSRNLSRQRNGCFPIVITVIVKSNSHNVVRYKTKYEFWSNCDDYSCSEKGIAEINRMVDLMKVPFPLHDVPLLWKSLVNRSEYSQASVENWSSMLEILFEFLKNVTDLVRKQNCDENYPFVELEITKFLKIPNEEQEEWLRRRSATGRAALAIEKVKFGGEAAESCGICLGDMSVGSEVVRTPCSHYGHGRCILPWLKKNSTCPFCRFKITPDYY